MRNGAFSLAARSLVRGLVAAAVFCLGMATATAQEAERLPGWERFDFWNGKMSVFGGPADEDMADDEDLALVFNERSFKLCRDLFLDKQPEDTTGYAKRLNPETMYVACRWNYKVTPLNILYHSKVKVTNPKTGKSVFARPVDFGPHGKTKRVADLSPGLAKALELKTDDTVAVDLYCPHVVLVSCHWNTGDDVDLVVEEPNGQKCHAGNPATKNGGTLTGANSTGFGRGKDDTPEEYAMRKSVPGEYVVKAVYTSGPRDRKKKPTTVTVDVTENAYLPTPKHKTYTAVLTDAGQTEEVCRVVIPGGPRTVDYTGILRETAKEVGLRTKEVKMDTGPTRYEFPEPPTDPAQAKDYPFTCDTRLTIVVCASPAEAKTCHEILVKGDGYKPVAVTGADEKTALGMRGQNSDIAMVHAIRGNLCLTVERWTGKDCDAVALKAMNALVRRLGEADK